MSAKSLGVVIPTHNRSEALLKCLNHLEKQTFNDFEVVVIDDGSTDDTPQKVEAYLTDTPLSIRYFRQSNSGPAKARNVGVSLVESPICLMLGDDIFASPTLVQQHLRLHQEQPDLKIAALGLTQWSVCGQRVTPFMRWLDECNIQFAYPHLLAGAEPNWGHFYTSNLSVKTDLLRMFSFSEDFPYAAMEDMELAYRITKTFGLSIKFLPEAVADHLHPTTFRQACKRNIRVGYSFGLFYAKWPQERFPDPIGMRRTVKLAVVRSPHFLSLLTTTADLVTKVYCPSRLMRYVLDCYYEIGRQNYLKSQAAESHPTDL